MEVQIHINSNVGSRLRLKERLGLNVQGVKVHHVSDVGLNVSDFQLQILSLKISDLILKNPRCAQGRVNKSLRALPVNTSWTKSCGWQVVSAIRCFSRDEQVTVEQLFLRTRTKQNKDLMSFVQAEPRSDAPKRGCSSGTTTQSPFWADDGAVLGCDSSER